ncbi:N-acetyltransferase [Zunongwangia sp.]|uniref:N-acetyltransferase n=1 Tax=Zunongwangia sp. TaxID=1965325 RepID=UPI003AA8C4FE
MENDDFEITDNEFLRQFEATIQEKLIVLEYTEQERKIFLSKLNIPQEIDNQENTDKFITAILEYIKENKNVRVMPTSQEVIKFMRRNRRKYKDLLPVGINI